MALTEAGMRMSTLLRDLRLRSVCEYRKSMQRERCRALLDGVRQRFHLLMVTVVPLPSSEAISNSSINRRTPDRPSPRPPEVE
jgi:hypothetical protein